jgi:hypothetical protein
MGGEAVAEFFRALRAVAGQPTYRQLSPQSQLSQLSQLSQRTHYPVATLSRAHRRTRADLVGGHSRLVTAYGRDPGTWRTHWRPTDRATRRGRRW